MSHDEFLSLVEKMRVAQRRYFAQKDNLEDCKALERQVDRAIARRREPPGLFDAPPASDEGVALP